MDYLTFPDFSYFFCKPISGLDIQDYTHYSHPLIISFSHSLIFPYSHHLIFSLSHFPIFPSSHFPIKKPQSAFAERGSN
jgi:hypothetical protein